MELGLSTRAASKRSKRQSKPSNKAAAAQAEKEDKLRRMRETGGKKKRKQKSRTGGMVDKKTSPTNPSGLDAAVGATKKKCRRPSLKNKQAEAPSAKTSPNINIPAALDGSLSSAGLTSKSPRPSITKKQAQSPFAKASPNINGPAALDGSPNITPRPIPKTK